MRYTDKSSFLCGAHEDIVYPRNIKLENIALVTTVEGIKLFAFFKETKYIKFSPSVTASFLSWSRDPLLLWPQSEWV